MTARRRFHLPAAMTATGLLLAACTGTAAATNGPTTTPANSPPARGTTSPAAAAHAPDASTAAAAAAAAPPPAADACALVTEHDITPVLGTDPGPGSPDTSRGSSQCQYGSYQTQLVLVNLNPTGGNALYQNMRTNPKTGAGGTITDITGIGDKAITITITHSAAIYFTKNDALILVNVVNNTVTTPPTAQALTLAKTAASRI